MNTIIPGAAVLACVALVPLAQADLDADLVQELRPAGAAAGDGFGWSVDVDADVAVVGIPFRDTPWHLDAGAAEVWVRRDGRWQRQSVLAAADGVAQDRFGSTVSIDGDVLAVDAPRFRHRGGTVYVYGRRGDSWVLEARLAIGSDFDELRTLDVSGDTLVVGDLTASVHPYYGWRGAVHVFTRSDGTWSHEATITVAPPDSTFGWSVSIDGDTLAVGEPYRDTEGIVHVYTRTNGVWTEEATLRGELDYGYEVTVDQDTLAITKPVHSSDNLGRIDIHTRQNGLWTWQSTVFAADHGYDEPEVPALSGDILLLGGAHETGSLADALSRRAGSWGPGARLATDGPEIGFRFGTAVDGETALLGRPWADGGDAATGVVDVYRLRCRLPVEIDVKPGSPDNPIHPGGRERIPVAILGRADLDVSTIDASTLRFGPAGAAPIHDGGHIEDVDLDGFPDLLQHYRTSETGIPCGAETATVTGETFDGCLVAGTDTIDTVGACP